MVMSPKAVGATFNRTRELLDCRQYLVGFYLFLRDSDIESHRHGEDSAISPMAIKPTPQTRGQSPLLFRVSQTPRSVRPAVSGTIMAIQKMKAPTCNLL